MQILIYISLALLNLFSVNLYADPYVSVKVFGDSHSREFNNIPGCTVHWIGPVTMHRIGRDGVTFLYLPSWGVLEGEVAVFSFGEIDVRCHLGMQRDLYNRSLDEVIDTLAVCYFNTILINRSAYDNLRCIVYSVTPPTSNGLNPAYPYYGTLEDRVMITKKLNKKLADLCSLTGVTFLDVYDDYANSEGSLNYALSDGHVHIRTECNQAIQQKLFQILYP